MLNHILVPVDGSALSHEALTFATRIIDPAGTLSLLTVIDIPFRNIGYSADVMPLISSQEFMAKFEEESEKLRQDATAYLEQLGATVTIVTVAIRHCVAFGHPDAEIIQFVEKNHPDAIVMATHGRTGLSRWFLGSVTQRVLNVCPIPVFVIPMQHRAATDS